MNLLTWLSSFRPQKILLIGWISFQLGLFFLASSPFISVLFFLIALFFGSYKRLRYFFKDQWNYIFTLISLLMSIGSFNAYSGSLAWIGLANWIPLFFCCWAFQPYLLTAQARQRSGVLLLLGTFPVVFTGIGQMWFGLHGSWEVLNGLIIWFNDADGQPTGRLSGLFSHANIAGSWLALVFPFSLATFLQTTLNFSKRSMAFVWVLFIVIALVLTNSRNAWGGLFLSIPLVLGVGTWSWLLPFLAMILLPIALAVFPFVPMEIQALSRKIVPEGLWARLSDLQFAGQRPLETTRLFQWKEAITVISSKPWFGYGAAAFSILYPLRQGIWHGHTHNLPLELAVAHGLPAAVLLVSTVLLLLIVSYKKCFGVQTALRSNVFDRAWWAATFILVFLHASDIPMFDSRINFVGWIFLAGLRCMILTSNSKRFLMFD